MPTHDRSMPSVQGGNNAKSLISGKKLWSRQEVVEAESEGAAEHWCTTGTCDLPESSGRAGDFRVSSGRVIVTDRLR